MREPNRRCPWEDFRAIVEHEIAACGGFGELTLRVVCYQGAPKDVFVDKVVPHYRIGGAELPRRLTAEGPKPRMAKSD